MAGAAGGSTTRQQTARVIAYDARFRVCVRAFRRFVTNPDGNNLRWTTTPAMAQLDGVLQAPPPIFPPRPRPSML